MQLTAVLYVDPLSALLHRVAAGRRDHPSLVCSNKVDLLKLEQCALSNHLQGGVHCGFDEHVWHYPLPVTSPSVARTAHLERPALHSLSSCYCAIAEMTLY